MKAMMGWGGLRQKPKEKNRMRGDAHISKSKIQEVS